MGQGKLGAADPPLLSLTLFNSQQRRALRSGKRLERAGGAHKDCGEAVAYCSFGAAQFQMPNPMLRRALSRYGYSPRAVLALTRVAGVDLFDAMYRVTHGFLGSDARRTAFLTQGSYLRKAVTTNAWFPHKATDFPRSP
ncbi:hypothetical protein [Deinococcus hopiensis]|uniref:Uncharacterized protein n=1 Tax=Deinococcus hopiensis KR-140 TaxID=695939 RepID=A0A1W1UPZ0_9DEIO|nr:hypothetical protein [Deinococcus hopiensis]SMB83103.1 hypothetical protein SAMN00790413_04262 [Deinococcus hopiensis KR-140]